MAESAPQLPEDDIEAAAQQPVPDENAPADGDKSSHSDQLSEVTYEQSLYHYVRGFPATMGCVDFEDLSEMNIVHLMNELAKYDQAMRKDEAAPQDIEHVGDLVHRYSKCVFCNGDSISTYVFACQLPRFRTASIGPDSQSMGS